jgi:hypothetical protein
MATERAMTGVVAIMAIFTGAIACGGDDDDSSGDIDSGGDGNIDAGSNGDGGGDGGVTGDLFSRGAMQVGSAIVNGVRYDDSAAEVSVDDAHGGIDDLGDGMVVEVHGHADDSGFIADTVEVENEIRGTIDVFGPLPEDFVVMAHRVVTDGQVVFVDVADLAGDGQDRPVGLRGQVIVDLDEVATRRLLRGDNPLGVLRAGDDIAPRPDRRIVADGNFAGVNRKLNRITSAISSSG